MVSNVNEGSMQTDKSKKLVAFLAVMIVVVAIVGTIALSKKQQDKVSTVTSADSSSNNVDTTAPAVTTGAASYRDGTYTAEGSYNTPGGDESITITVTLQNGLVTSTSATSTPMDSDAQEYQDAFKSAYKGQVVGKKVDNLRLSRVAGSSLTSIGFNNALDQIKNQAQV